MHLAVVLNSVSWPAVSLLGCLESEQLSAATQVSWYHTSGCAEPTQHCCQDDSGEYPTAADADLYCRHIRRGPGLGSLPR
jgi:hypothetical protein